MQTLRLPLEIADLVDSKFTNRLEKPRHAVAPIKWRPIFMTKKQLML